MGGGVTQSFTGTIATSNTMANCTYKLPVTATSGSITHSTSVFVTVNNGATPDFTVSTYNINAQAGYGEEVAATLGLSGCMSGVPAFSFSGSLVTAGITVSAFSPATVSGPGTVNSLYLIGVPTGTAAGTYSGQLNVTIAGVSHSTPFAVTVLAPAQPYYSLVSQMPSNQTAIVVPQGGSSQTFIVLQPWNGYAGTPTLSAAGLPTGISVAFSNNAVETNGVVIATISANNLAVPSSTQTSFWVDGYDGAASYSLNIPFTIAAAPLTINATSIMFSNTDKNPPHKAGTATVRAKVTGGLAPLTYVWGYDGAASPQTCPLPSAPCPPPAYMVPVSSNPQTVTLYVTDSGSPPNVSSPVTISIPAAPAMPQALLYAAVLSRVAALGDFAAYLDAQGADSTYIRGLVPAQANISSGQYSALVNDAVNYRNDLASLKTSLFSATAGVHKQGLSAQYTTGGTRSTIDADYAGAGALAGNYVTTASNHLGGSFSGFDTSYAWGTVAPSLDWCDYDCGGANANNLQLVVDATITLDPGTNELMGHASETVTGFGEADPPEILCILHVTMDGAGTIPDITDALSADEEIMGVAENPGNYVIHADGMATLVDPFGDGWVDADSRTDVVTVTGSGGPNGGPCTGPVITGVQITPAGQSLPQPTSGLQANSIGTLQVNAACIDPSAQLFIAAPGVTFTAPSQPVGATALAAPYTVDPSAPAGSGSIYLTTDSGSATAPVQVVPAVPYITSIVPGSWPAGQTTTISISGAGFGGGIGQGAALGMISFVSPLNFQMHWSLATWNDNLITGTVTPDGSDPGETIAVSITGGSYGAGFLPNQGSGQSTPTGNGTAQVRGASAPAISITSNGFDITTARCNGSSGNAALISPGGVFSPPIMPPLTYILQNAPAGNITWTLTVNDGRADKHGPDVITYTAVVSVGPNSTQNWGTLGNIGGNATITASYTGGSASAPFCILGANPVVSNVISYLQTQPGYFWPVPFLVQQESSTQQFNNHNNSNTPYGFPISDGPNAWGYGVMQLTNPPGTTDQLWNWQSNVIAGMELLNSLESDGDDFWETQYATSAGSPILIGNDSESTCTFAPSFGRTPAGSPHSYADAIILKRYNSAATNHQYIGFDVPADPVNPRNPNPQLGISPITVWSQPAVGSANWTAPAPPTPMVWYVQQRAKNLTNYVEAVCSHGN